MHQLPLCIDMDGTLLKTDTLLELLVRVLKQNPLLLLYLPIWLLQGKAVLKRELSLRCQLQPALLPVNREFLDFLLEEHRKGRSIYLATGAYRNVAESIAQHYGIFSGVFATQEKNLTGKNKADLLVQQFGKQGFAYAGNDIVDIPCWEKAGDCYLVNATSSLTKTVQKQISFANTFDLRSGLTIKLLLRGMRIHQWAKNALIFVPMLAAHHLLQWNSLQNTVLAFLAFGFCASLSYIVNDIGDLDADRQHRSKCRRPFASGDIPIITGLVLVLLLLLATVSLSLSLSAKFALSLLVYFVITNAYTLRLKYIPVLDVAILAGLYTLRVIAGGFAAQVETSFWLLAFSCFIFFSLAIVKRLSELQAIKTPIHDKPVQCRGYWTSDIPVLTGLGTASAMMAVLVLALYINSPEIVALYSSPRYLWVLCPVIALWLGRVWLITGRNEMHDDPVVFALRDRTSWLLFGFAALFMIVGANI